MIELPPFDALALSLHHSPGVQAILVGSGLSRAAGIPTGWEITLDMVRRLAALDGVMEQEDWAKWYKEKYHKEPSYSEILDALASTPAERRAILHSYIDAPPDGGTRSPTKAHQAIAELVANGTVRVIITTNFDRLLENALRDVGIEPTVIASDDAIAGATPLVHARCTVVKVHGDYLDARIKNTDAELADYSRAMNTLLDQIFDNFGLLVVGWSGEWDHALRSAIIRAPSRRYPLYWAARGSLGKLAEDLIVQRAGRSVLIGYADAFFTKLKITLEALRQATRPHPTSVEMAVMVAKRLCRDDQLEMEWNEYLYAEVSNIREYVKGAEYPTATPTAEVLNRVIEAFVSRSEILRRACLICGRWGTEKANRTVAKALRNLSFSSEDHGGYTTYVSLRDLGASLCFYWNMAGLIERGNLRAMHELQMTELKTTSTKLAMVEHFPFAAYEGVDWKFLIGMENHKTPASDFFASLFVREAKDISLDENNADDLFDRIELSVALGYAHLRDALVKSTGIWFWTPVGRFIWKRSGEKLTNELARIEALSEDDEFFTAGLLGGSKSNAAPTIKAVRDFHRENGRRFW